eukprot:768775-Hanusia_phi.AAC.3
MSGSTCAAPGRRSQIGGKYPSPPSYMDVKSWQDGTKQEQPTITEVQLARRLLDLSPGLVCCGRCSGKDLGGSGDGERTESEGAVPGGDDDV